MTLKEKIMLLQNNADIYFSLDGNKTFKENGGGITESTDKICFKNIDKLRLGALGELYAQYIMSSFGYEVFPSVVDDHGVDLIAKKEDKVIKIQVKTVNVGTYVFFPEEKFKPARDENYLIMYIRVDADGSVRTYIYPSIIWKNEVGGEDWQIGQFVFHAYSEKESKPEYGIYGSDKYYKKGSELDSKFCISKEDNDWELDKDKFEGIIGDPKKRINEFWELLKVAKEN